MRRSPRRRPEAPAQPQPQPHYTFETFVIGPATVRHAAPAVAKNRQVIQPLYITEAPVWKDHLMNASPLRLASSTAEDPLRHQEKFMNELINHIQYGKILEFRQKYGASTCC